MDNMGRVLVPESVDRWPERIGLALALSRLPEAVNPNPVAHRSLRKGRLGDDPDTVAVEATVVVDDEDASRQRTDAWLLNMFRFLVPDGLNDRNESVRSVMLQAALSAIALFGKVGRRSCLLW